MRKLRSIDIKKDLGNNSARKVKKMRVKYHLCENKGLHSQEKVDENKACMNYICGKSK